MRYYFERAGRITENAQHHNTDESPCFAHGTLRLSSGQTVQWYIGELREAQLRGLPEGKALAIWDAYGPVGSWKNKTFEPMLFPDPTVPGSHPMSGPDSGKTRSGEQARRRPYTVSLPPELSLVVPAPIGVKFRRI